MQISIKQLRDRFSVKEIKINKAALYFLLMLSCCSLVYIGFQAFENDTFWLLNTGRYILKNGFPYTEPFTIHEGMAFSAQQWLTCVIFFFIDNLAGGNANIILVILLFFFTALLTFKTCMKLSDDNLFLSVLLSLFVVFYMKSFFVLRPMIFSFLIFSLEIFLLELFFHSTKANIKFLLALPVLSVLLVNLHSAMWPVFFLFLIPCLIDSIIAYIRTLDNPTFQTVKLLVTTIICILAGFLNPYGIKNMLYAFNSYGDSYILNGIIEMQSINFKSTFGIFVFVMFLTVFSCYFFYKGKTKIRYILMTAGFTYMALSSVRNIPLFIISAIPFLSYYLKELKFEKITLIKTKLSHGIISFLACLCLVFLVKNNVNTSTTYVSNAQPLGAVGYIINNKIDLSKMRIFNEYITGGYLEFCGIKPFVDSRAEIFLKSINKKDDILHDYFNLTYGSMHYYDLIKKYQLTHFLITKHHFLDTYISHDKNFVLLYEDKMFSLYKFSPQKDAPEKH